MQGQPICQKERVYFDYGSSQLSLSEQQDLSAFVASLNGVVLVELYGYTDTFNTVSFNQTLAKQRLETVKRWMSQNYQDSLVFKEFIIGEDGSGSKADSIKRRVEINSIPITNGYLKLSDDNASVEIPIDYYKECQICKNPPVFKFIDTEEEISRENIDLVSTNGEELVTCGMAKVEFNSCNGKKPPLCRFMICSFSMQDMAGLWLPNIINGRTLWEETKRTFSAPDSNGCVEIMTDKINFNCDYKKKRIYNYSLVVEKLGEDYIFTYPSIHQSVPTKENQVKIPIQSPFHQGKLFWITSDSGYYYFDYVSNLSFDTVLVKIETTTNLRKYFVDKNYYLKNTDLQRIVFSDTITKIKLPRKAKIDAIGFSIAIFKTFVPLREASKNIYTGRKPLLSTTPIVYIRNGKEKQVLRKYMRLKYYKEETTMVIKVKRRGLM